MRGCPVPWAVASGWALDLATGSPSRYHDDLDLVTPHATAHLLAHHLLADGWRLHLILPGGRYRELRQPAPIPTDLHQLHARRDGAFLDVLLEPWDDDRWRYRRHPAITRPLATALHTARQVPFLAPELVLLFKANTRGGPPRPKDQRDFDRVAPRLGQEARQWLADALGVCAPGHGWMARLG